MGKIKFLNCKIDCSQKVFQPRIETEYWVGKAIKEIKRELRIRNQESGIRNCELKVLDIFAGTGCIGIAVLKNCPEFVGRVDFADISKEAVRQIKINLRLNKISENKYNICRSDLFEKLKGKKYNFIFANPPYVALGRLKEVQKEVLKREPKESLFAGRDGMFWLEKFIPQVKQYLEPGGKIFQEFDPLQKEEIGKLLMKKRAFQFLFKKDQFGKYRWLEMCCRG